MIPAGERTEKLFLFYVKNRDDPKEEVCFEFGTVHFTTETNPLETLTDFIREIFPELYYSQMTEIGKITKPVGKVQLIGFVFTLKDPETAYQTGQKSEVFVALSRLPGAATPEEARYALSLFKNSPRFILGNYRTFFPDEADAESADIDPVLRKMSHAIPQAWGSA